MGLTPSDVATARAWAAIDQIAGTLQQHAANEFQHFVRGQMDGLGKKLNDGFGIFRAELAT